jgi:hypothetical protein
MRNSVQQPNRRRTDTLDYMQSVLGQMRTMAKAERCDMLTYLIEMAYIEVSDIIRGERPLRVRDESHGPTGIPFKTASKI